VQTEQGCFTTVTWAHWGMPSTGHQLTQWYIMFTAQLATSQHDYETETVLCPTQDHSVGSVDLRCTAVFCSISVMFFMTDTTLMQKKKYYTKTQPAQKWYLGYSYTPRSMKPQQFTLNHDVTNSVDSQLLHDKLTNEQVRKGTSPQICWVYLG